MPSSNWYDDAEAYDLAFGFPPGREAAFLLELLHRHDVAPPARLLEPMVGTGRLVLPLVDAGYRVTGFDLAPAMLRLARAHAPGATFFRADAARFACATAFAAAHCLIDSFRYLPTEDDAARFFAAVATALTPGAPFAIGLELHTPGEPTPESWTTTRDGLTAKTTILSHGDAGDGLEWMDAAVEIASDDPAQSRTVKSRMRQRIWTPPAFCAFLDRQDAFDVAGIWRRSQELHDPLDAFPPRGGPITVVLVRN
ncbi:MAG: hypothetical protein CMJ83_18655 [Planctomycetes bacterium]|jgi:SAM-dependent methyltransferase|nr:hypothetical protein [Planctomycetota bacterium]